MKCIMYIWIVCYDYMFLKIIKFIYKCLRLMNVEKIGCIVDWYMW